eukprot:TRINITY_DN11753_c0_g2_i1.p4 TRINITY_DN11753_c0_g2~~TRINITY_DN11753_c0_g2_i1.p4  ORF type:complete len:113 (+),score=15.16 TRINITY_DN11753_c0_g2_i1:22-360(+)
MSEVVSCCGVHACICFVVWCLHLFVIYFFFLMIRRPPRSTQGVSSAASDVYKRQVFPVGTELIVKLTFLFVLENFIGLVDLLELGLGFRIIGIEVRVILAGQFFEGLADIFL